ncbi:MAG: methyltransferase domain-containing protein [Candidatus Latescibacteria bacterium]|nr:methyltransferase domain-containing protein [Candidatus Latescibacterota bacterium]
MPLPPQLQRAIEQETGRHPPKALSQAAAELSAAYRAEQPGGAFITSELHRLAYAAVRLPATFAAVHAVFAEVRRRWPDLTVANLLDLGAGPGTAAWAAGEIFGELESFTLVEADAGLIALGKALARAGEHHLLEQARWAQGDLRALPAFAPCDLVVSSYALGELGEEAASAVLRAAWAVTVQVLVVVEPGTVRGFALIRRLRDELIATGAHLIAPCPHQEECPLPAGDWCHFSQRLERSRLHQRLKEGALGYEDEKFSYVAVARHLLQPAPARILRHPLRHAGHAELQLCTPTGLQTLTVTRSDKERWKEARKAEWGDEWRGGA